MTDRWVTYLCNVNSELASILLNAALLDDLVRRQKHTLLWIWLYFNQPRPDGLSSNEEAPMLYAIEDALTSSLEESCAAVLAGRITTLGRREFYFYAATADSFANTLATTMQSFPEYRFDSDHQPDPTWDQYRNVLYPSPEEWEKIGNRDVLSSLAKNGDDPAMPRPVYHFAFFSSRQLREAYMGETAKLGYKVDNRYKVEGENPYAVCVKRAQSIRQDEIDEASLELFRLCKKIGGIYNGWEAQATASSGKAH